MVLEKGLEPLNLSAPDPKSGVFANFTTQAHLMLLYKNIFTKKTKLFFKNMNQTLTKFSDTLKRDFSNTFLSFNEYANAKNLGISSPKPLFHLSNNVPHVPEDGLSVVL